MNPISLYEFGGNEAALRKIQKPLVKHFQGCAPVLDIGCGRGVFLELLAAAGIEAVGVDRSSEALAACRQKGLAIVAEDARSFLSREERQFGGIFCSHVIEHMGYDDALAFLQLCHRRIHLGGRLLIMTPNPEDLMVMGEIFWLDPTHVRPYPKRLLKAMLETVGFRVTLEKQYLGSLQMVGRRNLPWYLLRRLLMGRFYGRPNTLVLAEKDGECPPQAT